MALADALALNVSEERLLLHGIADAKVAEMIGAEGGVFAGVAVRAITKGRLAGLVSRVPRGLQWPAWMMRKPGSHGAAPIASALTSILSFVPVAPRTEFADIDEVGRMLTAREPELAGLVNEHAGLLECEVTALFDEERAGEDIAASGTLAALRAESEAEQTLVKRTLSQSVAGRRAGFLARLRRRILENSVDVLAGTTREEPNVLHRRVLISRERRGEFREGLMALAAESGPGTRLTIGPFLPPASFRVIEVRSADAGPVEAARAALGVDESTLRSSIRVAYHRALERAYPRLPEQERKARLAKLQAQFGLLDLVAEGQIKAARANSELTVRFNAEALSDTWLMRFHAHSPADRAA